METCEKVKSRLQDLNDPNTYSLWLSNLKMENNDNTLTFISTSEFAKNMIRDRFSDQIKTVLNEMSMKHYKLKFKWENPEEKNEEAPKKAEAKEPKNNSSNYLEVNPSSHELKLSPKFNFDTFVVGKNSQLAAAAAKAVVNALGSTYNPLFIYGKTGLGKTHLMQAIGHEVLQQNNKKKIIYLPCEGFTNLMIEAITNRKMEKFRAKFRKVDILMIDDIQFLAKKEQTQEVFFNTFNELYQDHKQIVLTSDCPPKEMTHLQERLVSRFEWGLVTDIQPPSFETRVSILKKKSELSHLSVPMEVLEFLAEHFDQNVRQMEGALNRVYTYSKLIGKALNLELARDVLKDLIKTEKIRRITIEDILQQVGKFYNITMLQMQGPKRLKNYAFPRQVAMYCARSMTDLSLPEIGQAFGGRDHTTVLHACKKINEQITGDTKLKEEIESLTHAIKGA